MKLFTQRLLFRTELEKDLFETKSITDGTINLYYSLEKETVPGTKDFFEFFYWVAEYMFKNGHDEALHQEAIERYSAVHPLTDGEKELLQHSFIVNKMLLEVEDFSIEEVTQAVDKALLLCEREEITHAASLLILQRIKLRKLLDSRTKASSEYIQEITEAQENVQKLLTEVEGMSVDSYSISIFFE